MARIAFFWLVLAAAAQAQGMPWMNSEPFGGGEPIQIVPEWHSTDFTQSATPIFTFTADFPILTRSSPGRQPFVYGTGGAVLLDAGDIGLSTEGAVRLGLIFYDESGWDLEFAYLGTEDFTYSDTFTDRNIVPHFFNGVPADPAESYVINYESNLHGGEFNLRRRCGPHAALLVGLRGLQLHEASDILRGDDTNSGFYSKSYNHLWGAQIGGDFRWWLNGVIGLNATLKGGIYSNNIEIYATALDATGEDQIDMYYNTSEAAFFGEFMAGIVISLGHYGEFRLGYVALLADGIALSIDQNDDFDLIDGRGTVDLGSPFYHGGYAGFGFTY